MMPASILAEAIRNQETVHVARERIESAPHVQANYRAIALPALAAAAKKVADKRRRAARHPAGTAVSGL